jgi:CHASE3 domain sensor protein
MENSLTTVLVSVVGLLAAGLGTLALYQIATMHRSLETDSRDQWKAIAEVNKTLGDIRESAATARGEHEKALSDFRAHVAENYPRNGRLDGLESRIFEKLDSIDRKLDTKQDKDHAHG